MKTRIAFVLAVCVVMMVSAGCETAKGFATGVGTGVYATAKGVVVMPWGLSSLAFPMTFGGDLSKASWVATDIRQVMIDGVAYQAKLGVWSLNGYQVNG